MEDGKYYHIYNRGNNKENIFLEKENYFFFLKKYKQYIAPFVDTYAYCLMPYHFHFLIKIKETELTANVLKTCEVIENKSTLTPIEKAFRDFFISYAKAFNKRNNRTGSLFQYKFKRKEINQDSYFSALIAYIHYNPVKASLCQNFTEWEFSSYNSIISNKTSSINREEIINWFGGIQDFIKFHTSYPEEPINEYLIDHEN